MENVYQTAVFSLAVALLHQRSGVKRKVKATIDQKKDQYRVNLENQFALGKNKADVAWCANDNWLQREGKRNLYRKRKPCIERDEHLLCSI